MNLVIASLNEGKAAELKEILGGFFDEVYSLNDLGVKQTPEEDGDTFAQNAKIKARFVRDFLDASNTSFACAAALSDDSGLCVEALNGAPGVFSARYGGRDEKMCRQRLLSELGDSKNRRAKFVCALCLIYPDGTVIAAEGETRGEITDASFEDKGAHGFGYDRLFLSDDLGTTFGLAPPEQKNSVSHRSRAVQALLAKI